ncbi:MAG: GIY-YIG nuclease family protein [Chitinophagaceae bacterium]|nr:GIY-YIG nuclease family protein [Chitinophagaceae bacterium]
MYAIVDIETTGGYAAGNDITELAIVLHDGVKPVDRFETLVKPSVPIPQFIQSLTGIDHAMVENAPAFEAIAGDVYELLKDSVFVAHNVNFDYSFLKHHLSLAGFDLSVRKLCTVRLARKVFPSLPSYSLGNLCRHFNIGIQNRHRAGGDADATAELFELILQNNGETHIRQFLKKGSGEQFLPLNLPREQVDRLPYSPGVYYFHDQKGRIIYVGKAKNIKYRVRSHFTHNGPGRQRQEFMRNIYGISYQECGTELMAFILENIEIRKYWPQYNSSQKGFAAVLGLYAYEDQKGYLRLAIDKQKKSLKAIYTFNMAAEGQRLLRQLMKEFSLCPKLCNIQLGHGACSGIAEGYCRGVCEQQEAPQSYNRRVEEAMVYLEKLLPSFAVIDKGNDSESRSCILVENGRFYGMGYIPNDVAVYSSGELKTYLEQYPENDYIRGLIYQYVQKSPDKRVVFDAHTADAL